MGRLTWRLKEIKYGCENSDNWVTVTPTSGDDKVTPRISTSHADGFNDCTSAFVTFSMSNGTEETINVTRCLPECTCESLGFTQILGNVSANKQEDIIIGRYNNNYCAKYANVATDGTVLCNPYTTINGEKIEIRATVNENITTSQRNGWYRYFFKGEACGDIKQIIQSGRTDACANDDGSSVSVTPSVVTAQANGGSSAYTINNNSCWVYLGCSTSDSWITIDDNSFSVSENESQISGRDGIIVFNFYNKSRNQIISKRIHISQDFIPPYVCDCNNTISNVSGKTEIPYEGYTELTKIGIITVNENCLSESIGVRITSPNSDWISNLRLTGSGEHREVKAIVSENTDTENGRGANIKCTINGELCGPTMYVSQLPAYVPPTPPTECNCQNAQLSIAESLTVYAKAMDNSGVTEYTTVCDPEPTFVVSPSVDWITEASMHDGKLYLTTTDNTSLEDEREGSVSIKINDRECKTVTINQEASALTPTFFYLYMKLRSHMPSTQNDISVDYVVFSTSKGDVWAQNIERGSHKIATGEEKTFQFKIFTIYGTEFTKIKVLDDTTTPGTELTFNTIYNGEKIIESRDMDNPYYIIIEDD